MSVTAVTVSGRFCAACGADISTRRQQTRTCSDACRQTWSRMRRRNGNRDNGAPVALTAAQRAWLRAEIDRRTRWCLQAQDAHQRKTDARLNDGREIAA